MRKTGWFPPPIAGEYQLNSTIQGLFKYYREGHSTTRTELEKEKLLNLQKVNRDLDREHDLKMGKLIEAETVYRHFQPLFIALRQRILASSLTQAESYELLTNLSRITTRDLPKGDGEEALPDAPNPTTASAE